jgi:microcystin degradation protein MlrC|tara:strand:+ start:159 stop:1655 length:1497 start_codon:yes stop_codon:yes gene_type:complete
MRIVTGAFSHESSTFTPLVTDREAYESRFGYLRGEQMLTTFRDTNTPVGGFIEGADAHGFELIPTLFAEPHPSGPTGRALFDEILAELLEGVSAAGVVDGVLLEMHGSMVAEGIADADGHILRALRDVVGPFVPIVVQLDIHTNMSAEMIECADALIVRETYPEVDKAERGRECADLLVRILQEGIQPSMRACFIPMMWGMNQVTADAPMKETIERLHEIETRPGVLCASVATCFPLADVHCMGASVTVVTDGDAELAQACADELGAWIYEQRAQWHLPRRSTQQVLEQVQADGLFPAILADRDDNTGGGAPGDSTGMLQAFVDAGLKDACVLYIVDTESVAACFAAGVGAQIELQVGGKSAPIQGEPVTMQVRVIAISDGQYRYDGPMYAGLEATMGPSAHVEQDGLHVLLVTIREQPFDTAFARTLGLDPRQMRYVGVKSAAHFRSGFGDWAGCVHLVAEPSVHSPWAVTFHNLGRQVFPLDEGGRFDPTLLEEGR